MSPPFIVPNDTGSPRQSLPPQPTSLSTHVDSANHWLVAYVKAVSPFSSTKFTIQDVTELQRIITADTLKLCSVDAKVLCKAFIECTMVAHGSYRSIWGVFHATRISFFVVWDFGFSRAALFVRFVLLF
jgi:hypothetical protein